MMAAAGCDGFAHPGGPELHEILFAVMTAPANDSRNTLFSTAVQ